MASDPGRATRSNRTAAAIVAGTATAKACRSRPSAPQSQSDTPRATIPPMTHPVIPAAAPWSSPDRCRGGARRTGWPRRRAPRVTTASTTATTTSSIRTRPRTRGRRPRTGCRPVRRDPATNSLAGLERKGGVGVEEEVARTRPRRTRTVGDAASFEEVGAGRAQAGRQRLGPLVPARADLVARHLGRTVDRGSAPAAAASPRPPGRRRRRSSSQKDARRSGSCAPPTPAGGQRGDARHRRAVGDRLAMRISRLPVAAGPGGRSRQVVGGARR